MALQSVGGLEDIHDLGKDISDEVVAEWTGKQRPQERWNVGRYSIGSRLTRKARLVGMLA